MREYCLYNASIDEVRAYQLMTMELADDLNDMYREKGEDWRWVPSASELERETYP